MGNGDLRHETHHFSKHRAEALSDGVFAIAMTLLVLELKVPTGFERGHLWAALSEESNLWYSVVLTFVITSVFWTLQHRVFDLLEHVSKPHLALTFLTLGLVTVLPFSTSLLGHAKGDPVAFELYFGNQSAIALSLAMKLEIARWQGGLRNDAYTLHTRLRLWTLAAVMLSAVPAAGLMPLQRMFAVPILLGAALRVGRKRIERRLARVAGV